MGLAFLIATIFGLFVLTASAITSYKQSAEESKAVGNANFGKKPKVSWGQPIIFGVAAFVLVIVMALITD